jgi:hypothetical protein
MARADSPAWRRAFDEVERRIGPALSSATNSPDFQVTLQELQRVNRTIASGVNGIVSWGLHVAGLPAHSDIRDLRRQLGEVQRELLSLRLDLARTPDEDSE